MSQLLIGKMLPSYNTRYHESGCFKKLKKSLVFRICDVRECITLTTIMQKDVFDNNSCTKALRIDNFVV